MAEIELRKMVTRHSGCLALHRVMIRVNEFAVTINRKFTAASSALIQF